MNVIKVVHYCAYVCVRVHVCMCARMCVNVCVGDFALPMLCTGLIFLYINLGSSKIMLSACRHNRRLAKRYCEYQKNMDLSELKRYFKV